MEISMYHGRNQSLMIYNPRSDGQDLAARRVHGSIEFQPHCAHSTEQQNPGVARIWFGSGQPAEFPSTGEYRDIVMSTTQSYWSYYRGIVAIQFSSSANATPHGLCAVCDCPFPLARFWTPCCSTANPPLARCTYVSTVRQGRQAGRAGKFRPSSTRTKV
ncbi:hypothetical protein BDW67DRAFT_165237, partial [Aspergillus spinulosporus]